MPAFRDRKDADRMPTERVRERFSPGKVIAALGTLVKGGNLRLLQRLGLAFLLVTLLGAGTSAAGLWFTNTAAQSVQTVQRASEQIQGIERLQRQWFRVVSSVDLMLLTRSLSGMQGELEQNLANFQTQLASVAEQMAQTGNAADIQEAQQIALELDGVMEEFYGLIRAGRWGSAQTVRYAKLSTLQTRLEESMSVLNQKIQADVQQSMVTAQRTQALARAVWAAAAILALAFSAAISWYSSRAIARPIEELTDTVEKVTAGGVAGVGDAVRAITPPERKDEIGEMWRAFATLTEWLSEAYQTQEKRVEERTRDLERRRLQVQAAAEVARDITGGGESRDEFADNSQAGRKSSRGMMKSLLDKSVDLIRDRFGFYHAGIFLIDGLREYALLRAATGQAGEQMVANHHRLKVGQIGLVGMVAETGQPRIALDVDKDAAHFRNPLLPETRSEVALPLRSRDQIIGVLDVQSQNPAAFDEQDVIILQIIADQLATAIENRRLVSELEIRLQELESFTAEYGRQSWERLAQSGALTGLEYDGEGVKPLDQIEADGRSTSAGFRRFPLKLRDEVIATLDVWSGSEGFSAEDIFLLETFTSRVSQILESARLFNEAQQRATREQLLNQLTSTIVRSIEPQAVIQAAVQQLERLPAVSRAKIYLTPSAATEPPVERSVKSAAVVSIADNSDDGTPKGLQT